MESKRQDQYDGFEAQVAELDPFIDDLLMICKKHKIGNDDLSFVASLFEKGYMPKLTP